MGQVSASFYESVLNLLRAPYTGNLTDVLETWQRFEGGDASYNPLNTTRPMPGSHPYNAAGVQDYISAASGASATAMTLLNGRYPAIVAAFRANTPIDSWSVHPIPDEVDTWGTLGFAAYLRKLTPAQEDPRMTPQLAQMILDIWMAIYAPDLNAPNPDPAKWNNIEILRRQLVTIGAPYSPPQGPPPHPPAPIP